MWIWDKKKFRAGILNRWEFPPCSGKFFLIWFSEKLFCSNTWGRKFEY